VAAYRARIDGALRAAAQRQLGQAPLTAGPGGPVLVDIPWEEIPTFRRREAAPAPGVGQGPGQPGDVVGRRPAPGPGDSGDDGPGRVVVALDPADWEQLVLGDLQLPRLQPRPRGEAEEWGARWTSRRDRGPVQRLDAAATVRAAQRRRQAQGPAAPRLLRQDLRYRSWRTRPEPRARAVVGFLRDVSGSMGETERRWTLGIGWWLLQAVRRTYDAVAVDFWVHTTEAERVDEPAWWAARVTGGTTCHTAYTAIATAWRESYPPADWTWLLVHFTDGDDSAPDRAAAALRAAWLDAQLVGVVELRAHDTPGLRTRPASTLGRTLAALPDPPVRVVTVTRAEDAGAALRQLWGEAPAP
jgi:uncharacterized sporulation protein YeaH/YhbH (DUF444 family)